MGREAAREVTRALFVAQTPDDVSCLLCEHVGWIVEGERVDQLCSGDEQNRGSEADRDTREQNQGRARA